MTINIVKKTAIQVAWFSVLEIEPMIRPITAAAAAKIRAIKVASRKVRGVKK